MIIINARFLSQPITGVQRYAIELSLELKKLHPALIFVAPQNILHEELADDLDVVRLGNFTGHLWEQIDLPRYANKHKALLINLCNTAPVMYKEKLVVLHDVAFERYPMNFSFLFRTFYKTFVPQIVRRSRYVVTDSHFSKKEISELYQVRPERITVIPCAVSSDFKPFKKVEKDYVLAVSSISPHKNFRLLVLAFNKLDLKNLELRIVGDVSKNFSDAELVSVINSNENIKLLGRISDKELVQMYSSALCFVYPSLYEGFGIPPLEAQASGCPCLVSTAASLPEVYGDSVLYCDPYSIDDITLKLLILVTDSALRQKLKMLGFDNVKRFSWSKSALDMIELIGGKQ